MGSNLSNKIPQPSSFSPTKNKPRVNLDKRNFDNLVYEKGYDVYLDKSIVCPCKEKSANHAQPSCKNCGGTGYVFINRKQTRMVVQSLNISTKFKTWSAEKRGEVSITHLNEEQLKFMDRVVLINGLSEDSLNRFPIYYNGSSKKRTKTIYDIIEIKEIFMFNSIDSRLIKLENEVDYTVLSSSDNRGNVIEFNEKYNSVDNFTVSIRYTHRPEYLIRDIPHNIRNSRDFLSIGNDKETSFPLQAIGVLSHYVLDEQNYNDYLIDNTYTLKEDNNCKLK